MGEGRTKAGSTGSRGRSGNRRRARSASPDQPEFDFLAQAPAEADPAEAPTEPAPPVESKRFEALVPRSVVARGPRAAERWLLTDLEAALARRDPIAELARPLRIVVPSRALRAHVASQLVSRVPGGAVAGVLVQTLHGLAMEVLERSGDVDLGERGRADVFFGQAVRRAARSEPALAEVLESFRDGYESVEATVHDLFDAGFDESLEPVLLECLEDLDTTIEAHRRSAALVRVASATDRALASSERMHRSAWLRRAAEALEARGEAVLPCSGLWVHGFADATGAASDLIESLLRATRGAIVLGDPPDWREAAASEEEADAAGTSPGLAFARHFRERWSTLERIEAPNPGADSASALVETFQATNVSEELAAIAAQAQAAIDEGMAPESIAVVGRRPEEHALAIRRAFDDAGLAFSGVGLESVGGEADRWAAAFVRIARDRARTPVSVWLELRAAALRQTPSDAARLAHELRRRGFGRLEDFGVGPRKGADEIASATAGDAPLTRAIADGRRACDAIEAWPVEATISVHVDTLVAIAAPSERASEDGDPDEEDAFVALLAALGSLEAALPEDWSVAQTDVPGLVLRALGASRGVPVGGRGGGVQVLSVTEARALRFERVFVFGVQRDAFPRLVMEDPLLPDVHRIALAAVLPDLPVKQLGRDEERHLFAQLLCAAPRVCVSWHESGEFGEVRAASPLALQVVRERGLEVGSAAALAATAPTRALGDAQQVALAGSGPRSAALERAHAALCQERREELAELGVRSEIEAGPLAAARLDDLSERNRPPAPGGPLGPGFGFVGAPPESGSDPKRRYVTRLEALARCGWQMFLTRELGLGAPPDPLESLPAPDPLSVGNLVHRLLELESPFDDEGAEGELRLEDVVEREPLTPRTSEGRKSGAAAERARFVALLGLARQLRRDPPVPRRLREAFARLLARAAGPLAERAREIDAASESAGVLGAEVVGSVAARAGREHDRLWFRVDRVDRLAEALVATDFKTGRPESVGTKPRTQEQHEWRALRAGRRLQAMAYAMGLQELESAGLVAAPTSGRYVHLRPDLAESDRERYALGDEALWRDTFFESVELLGGALDRGVRAPRLFDPATAARSEPRACATCEVADACSRGDSGVRGRLEQWWLAGAAAPKSDPNDAKGPGDAAIAQELQWQIWDRSRAPERAASTKKKQSKAKRAKKTAEASP